MTQDDRPKDDVRRLADELTRQIRNEPVPARLKALAIELQTALNRTEPPNVEEDPTT